MVILFVTSIILYFQDRYINISHVPTNDSTVVNNNIM
jgi:hypothetical protein